jgi:hypothetical protein
MLSSSPDSLEDLVVPPLIQCDPSLPALQQPTMAGSLVLLGVLTLPAVSPCQVPFPGGAVHVHEAKGLFYKEAAATERKAIRNRIGQDFQLNGLDRALEQMMRMAYVNSPI